MALPILETVSDKGEVQKIISDIATAVFKSAKVSLDSAAKAVIPSIPNMVEEVLEDLQSGSVRTFNLALDKLDRLVQKLGVDLKDYSKELANFQTKREEKLVKSEEKIQQLKEKNIIATIEKSGDINILSKAEIVTRQNNLKNLEKNIAEMEKSLEKDRKLLQENNKLKTKAQANKKQEILVKSAKLEEDKQKADDQRQVLGSRSEDPSVFQKAREGVGNFVDEYVPTPIADVGSAFVDGLTAPIVAIKELGSTFAGLLKPLKIFKKLFVGLFGSLKKFALGLKASIIAMLPQLALGAAILAVMALIYLAMKKLRDFFGEGGPGSAGDIAGEAAGVGIGDETPAAEGDMSSKMQRRSIVDQETKKVIQPDDPNYDKIYERDTGKPAPKKGSVYMGEGKSKIMSLDSNGFVNSSSNFMNAENRMNLKTPDGLKPIDKDGSKNNANIVDASQKTAVTNNQFSGSSLGNVRNDDFSIHRSYVGT